MFAIRVSMPFANGLANCYGPAGAIYIDGVVKVRMLVRGLEDRDGKDPIKRQRGGNSDYASEPEHRRRNPQPNQTRWANASARHRPAFYLSHSTSASDRPPVKRR